MILEITRDLVKELSKIEIPKDIKKAVFLQVENLKLSAEIGKKKLKFSEEKAEKLGIKPPLLQIALNSSASMMYDWDDYLFAGHTGHSAVFTALALGEEFKIPEEKIMRAIFIGNEIGGRFGILTLIGPLNGQMMTHIHGIISATITEYLIGKIDNIPKRICSYISNPHFIHFEGFMGGETKVFTASFPIVQGVISSLFDVRENQYSEEGFMRIFSWNDFSEDTIKTIFSPDFFLTRTLMIKKYPGCAYVLPQIECALKIKREIEENFERFDIDCIKEIEVEYSIIPALLDVISSRYLDFSSHIPAQFSTYGAVALALCDKNFTPETYEKVRSHKNSILKIISKIKTKHNTKYTRKILEKVSDSFPFLYGEKPPSVKNILKAISHSHIKISHLLKEGVFIIPALITNRIKTERKIKDDFEFIFPAKVKIQYKDLLLEEEAISHSAPAISEDAEKNIQEKREIVIEKA